MKSSFALDGKHLEAYNWGVNNVPRLSEMASMKRLPSQEISFDPTAWVGFSAEQVELIRKGFMAGIDQAYAVEKAGDGVVEQRPEDESLDRLDARAAEAEDAGWTPADEESMCFVRETPRFNEAGEWIA